MKRIGKYYFLIFFLVLTGCARVYYGIERNYEFSKIKRVAVLGIRDYPGFKGTGEIVMGEVILGLVRNNYSVVERSKLNALLEEQKLSMSGVLDSMAIKKIGRITGVDAIITGSIIDYSPKQFIRIPIEISEKGGERLDFYYSSKKKGLIPVKVKEADRKSKTVEIRTIESSFGLSIRMIDVENGTIIWGGTYSYNSLNMTRAITKVLDKILVTLPRR